MWRCWSEPFDGVQLCMSPRRRKNPPAGPGRASGHTTSVERKGVMWNLQQILMGESPYWCPRLWRYTGMMHPLNAKSWHSLGTWFPLPGPCYQVTIQPEINMAGWILSAHQIRKAEGFINNQLYERGETECSNRHGTKNSLLQVQLKESRSVPKWPRRRLLLFARAKSIFRDFALLVLLYSPAWSCFSTI